MLMLRRFQWSEVVVVRSTKQSNKPKDKLIDALDTCHQEYQ